MVDSMVRLVTSAATLGSFFLRLLVKRRRGLWLVVVLVVLGTYPAGRQWYWYRLESKRLKDETVILSVAGMAAGRTGERIVKLLRYQRWVPFRIDLSDEPKVRMTEITLPGD